MEKPTKQQILDATNEQLAEWSAVWVMRYKKKELNRAIVYGGNIIYWETQNSQRIMNWNPAENIEQAWELVEKLISNPDIFILYKRAYSIWHCIFYLEKKYKGEAKNPSRAITITSLLAVIDND